MLGPHLVALYWEVLGLIGGSRSLECTFFAVSTFCPPRDEEAPLPHAPATRCCAQAYETKQMWTEPFENCEPK
jgi:hypothetical protein